MTEEKAIHESRHQFKNCRAAFRLLQGALVSGHYEIAREQRNELKEKLIALEKQNNSAFQFNADSIDNFFGQIPYLSQLMETEKKHLKKLKIGERKIIVVDDQYKKAGWSEVFELMFDKDAVEGFENTESVLNYLKEAGKKRQSVFLIFVDLNFATSETPDSKGINLITTLSRRYPSIPLVAFTAYDSTVWVKKAFDEGAWDYFSKDPNEKEAHDYKGAIEYYAQFTEIIAYYQEYHQKYAALNAKVNRAVGLPTQLNFDNEFRSRLTECLWMAYRYCVLDYVIRFSPGFFDESKEDEVVFQSAKAFEYFLAMVFNKYEIKPIVEANFAYRSKGLELGKKLDLAKLHNDKLGFEESWYDKASFIKKSRNTNTHGESFSIREKKFMLNSDKLTEKKSQDFFNAVLDCLISGMEKLGKK